MADFTCSNNTFAISSDGISYVEDCNVFYETNNNMLAPDDLNWVKNLPGSPVTKYSFIDCINHCDEYNSDNKPTNISLKCYGISYYANLTDVFKRSWGG